MMRTPLRLLVARARRPERLYQSVNAHGDLDMDCSHRSGLDRVVMGASSRGRSGQFQ